MSRRTNRLAGQLGSFAQHYARKAQRGSEPNDRGHSRETEAEMKRLPPEELSNLLAGDTDELVPVVAPRKKRASPDQFAQYVKRKL